MIGIVPLRILKIFILPIARSTCIRNEAIFLPSCISFAGSCAHPSRKEGILRSTPISFSMPCIVNPLSAMMDIPSLSPIVFKKPDSQVSSTSEMEPTNMGDMYEIAPFGVQATKEVLWCLY